MAHWFRKKNQVIILPEEEPVLALTNLEKFKIPNT